MKVPVVFFVFNRPTQTERVLSQIILAKPVRLYIFADGPRNKEEQVKTNLVRTAIDKKLKNTSIKVIRNFASANRGLTVSITDGLKEVFKNEKEAIILEDDCLPNQSFFPYAAELLEKYRHNSNILSISGRSSLSFDNLSYGFSNYPQCWGWATWARAWGKYNFKITNKKFEKTLLQKVPNLTEKIFWKTVIKLIRDRKISTWDYQWTFTHLLEGGLAVTPSVNLVQNIGFGSEATNTRFSLTKDNISKTIHFPLIHPTNIAASEKINKFIRQSNYLAPIPILGLIKKLLIG